MQSEPPESRARKDKPMTATVPTLTELVELLREARKHVAGHVELMRENSTDPRDAERLAPFIADTQALLKRIDAALASRSGGMVSIKMLVNMLEASAANTDTDWRWQTATALRQHPHWETATIPLAASGGKG
jgi:hypothetical protein